MERFWTCKICSEEVESNYDICWNCKSDKSGSTLTFENIKLEIGNEEKEIEKRIQDERLKRSQVEQLLIHNDNIHIAGHNIVTAGKNLKSIPWIILIMTLFAIVAVVIANSSTDLNSIKDVIIFLGIASVICNIIVLYKLYSAGDNLENSVYKKKAE